MDINELLGKATKTIGKIKWVGNDSTSELITKAKAAVANTKPRPKKPVVSEDETISEDEIIERHNKNNPWDIVEINTDMPKKASNSPFKYSEVELEKIQHNDDSNKPTGNMKTIEEPVKDVPEIKPDDRDSLENVIMMIKNISDSDPESAKKLIPITTKLLSKLGNAKFSYEDLDEISKKHFAE